jgi:hypothetical protein
MLLLYWNIYGSIWVMSDHEFPRDVFGPPKIGEMHLPDLHPSLADLSIQGDEVTDEVVPRGGARPASEPVVRRPVPEVRPSNVDTYDEKPHGVYRTAGGGQTYLK